MSAPTIGKLERVALSSTQEGGGYRSPEETWPEIQNRIIIAMNKLEQALRPFLNQLKLNA